MSHYYDTVSHAAPENIACEASIVSPQPRSRRLRLLMKLRAPLLVVVAGASAVSATAAMIVVGSLFAGMYDDASVVGAYAGHWAATAGLTLMVSWSALFVLFAAIAVDGSAGGCDE